MNDRLSRTLRRVRLDGFHEAVSRRLRLARRSVRKLDHTIAERYLAAHRFRMLHVGCGQNVLDGWLNSDYLPPTDTVMHLDASARFRFDDGVFDRIYSEHMIEHVTYGRGFAMLKECHRVLKKGGRIRISTPDFQFLMALYGPERSQLQEEYIAWMTGGYIPDAPYHDAIFVINTFVRDWGHTFIYDEKTLRASLERAGFTGVRQYTVNRSDDPRFLNLEHVRRMPVGFLELESLILEASKD